MADKRIMRLTWNSNNWEYPSGHPWKYENQGNPDKAYENQYGYGHEEWLFNPRYRKDGYQYGYIRGVDGLGSEVEKLDEVYLYTIDPKTKNRLVLGSIKDVVIIEGVEEELEKIRPIYERYLETAIEELDFVNADAKTFRKSSEYFEPNVKFKPSNSDIYINPQNTEILKQPRFNRFQPYKLDEELEEALSTKWLHEAEFKFKSGSASPKQPHTKNTKKKSVDVNSLHVEISNDLGKFLKKQQGVDKEALSIELTKVGTSIVDVATKTDEKYTIFEIKTSNIGLLNIRQAIGQLLEYAFLDSKISLDKLVIVGPAELNDSELNYLKRLNEQLKVSLEYWAYDSNNELKYRFIKQ